METAIYPKIGDFLNSLDANQVSSERAAVLKELAHQVKERLEQGLPVELRFICTHNSRRSHFGQIWAQVIAEHNGMYEITFSSAGTEITALNQQVVHTLIRQGFEIPIPEQKSNPHYEIQYADNRASILAFSKNLQEESLLKSNFIAIMTCSEADQGCPFVPGALSRVALPFEDPKIADGTAEEEKVYLERSIQIAREMKLLFQYIV
ncbi:protein-tyrosine-phosphatase [Sphingobacterium lactis]|uniref:protein-tyrosine-phosphatase n=1 Tax=Sphingobacterium lactis TaxID=797291 RepID=UPI003F7DBC6E